MRGSLTWAFALALVSNILSVPALLSFPYILAYWIAYLLFFALRAFRVGTPHIAWPHIAWPRIVWLKANRYVYALACIALLTLAVAVLCPPQIRDALTPMSGAVQSWWQSSLWHEYYWRIMRQTGVYTLPFIIICLIIYMLFFALRAFRRESPHVPQPRPTGYVYAMACIALLTLAVAVLYPPHYWDAMTYHLPKVMHWWQNGSLEHYYTNIVRQTGLSPFAELVIFHSFVLSGTDYLANLVQWSAFIGIMFAAAATASLLGASKSGQALAAFFCATLPMGIVQASSVQTNLVVGFWLLCVAARFVIWKNESTTSNAAYFGMAVGLAILTKGIAYVISFPFVLAFACISIKNYRVLLLKAAISGLIAISIFMPHVYRNYATYNDPLVSGFGARDTILFPPSVQTFIVTALANLLSNAPIPYIQDSIDQAYEKVLAGLAVDPNDTAIFPWAPVSERYKRFSTSEGGAQNPLHLILLLCCLCGLGIRGNTAANGHRWRVVASACLFCLFIAWQPWISRLQIPLFLLTAPLAGMALEKACGKKLRDLCCTLIILYCIPSILENQMRPLLPSAFGTPSYSAWERSREELFFRHNIPYFRERSIAAADMLVKEGAASIGLVVGENSLEYTLWALLRARVAVMPEIRHVIPPETADGAPATPGTFVPQYLFVMDRRLAWEKQDEVTNDPLHLQLQWQAWKNDPSLKPPIRLFKRENGVYTRIF